jgi:hypothetical protein
MRRRSSFAGAILLIGVGLFYLAVAMLPAVKELAYGRETWPYQVIALGLLFYVAGILAFSPALFIPATIITGLGGILYYQNITGNWASWAYMWALLPGFAGLGLLLFGLFGRKMGAIIGGLWCLFSGLIFFSIFGLAFGHLPYMDKVWPLAIILLGFFLLLRAIRRKNVARE